MFSYLGGPLFSAVTDFAGGHLRFDPPYVQVVVQYGDTNDNKLKYRVCTA